MHIPVIIFSSAVANDDSSKGRLRNAFHHAMSTITVGVLALQGAFSEHLQLLRRASAIHQNWSRKLQWLFIEVRNTEDLERCEALIIPGGESTTMSLVASRSGLLEPLRDFVK